MVKGKLTVSARCSGERCVFALADVSVPTFETFSAMHARTVVASLGHTVARRTDRTHVLLVGKLKITFHYYQ